MTTSGETAAPQPKTRESRLADPGLLDLSRRDYLAAFRRAVKKSLDDRITDSAAAIAYYTFLALPAFLLVAVGIFAVAGGPSAIETIVSRVDDVVPPEATTLIRDALERTTEGGGGVALISVGSLLALWTSTGAMTAYMRALNGVYDRREGRGFLRQRLVALAMMGLGALAFLLVFGLLVLGPQLSGRVGRAVGLETAVQWTWWAGQWPILVGALLLLFSVVLYLGPNVDHPRWRFLTPGAAVAVVIWLAASAGFSAYVSMFSSYDKTWGSLAAVIIMLMWLWISALALLFGAEVNAEIERSWELRQGEPAEARLQAPART
jgi:membrane protein